jgi:DNA-binding winged helix-turn-helix (wHTH) protein
VRVGFGDCVVDTDRRELTKAGGAVSLQPKGFRLLEVLLERWPRAVSQQELRTLLWPDTPSGGTRVARVVNEVRDALGDVKKPHRLIRTVHRFGYAFVAEAHPLEPAGLPPPSASGWLRWRDRDYPLAEGDNLLGRDEDCVVALPSGKVSRRHARIRLTKGEALLEDLGSKNGTYVGDRRVEAPTALADGDEIRLGSVLLVFRARPAAGSTETAAER